LRGEEWEEGLDLLSHFELGALAVRGEGASRPARLSVKICHCLQLRSQLRGFARGRLAALNRLWEADAEGIGGRE
jgi:hypothetical protein